jgi:putative acetyltransferase
MALAPLAVGYDRRRQGVAARLIVQGLAALKEREACGCVVLGDPAYYSRFGFACNPV